MKCEGTNADSVDISKDKKGILQNITKDNKGIYMDQFLGEVWARISHSICSR